MRNLRIEKLAIGHSECLAKESYKFMHGLSLPIMNDIFKVRDNIYNRRNFQSFYSTRKKTVRFGTETVTSRGRWIWNLIPDNIKNVSSR